MAKTRPSAPRSTESLLSATALGGVQARRGMRFQDLWIVHNLAGWIVDPLFRGFVNEGREDVDTSRFIDERQRAFALERWQLKDRSISKQLLADVLAGFDTQQRARTDAGDTAVHRFHLVARGSDQDVGTLPELIERVRNARTAYGEQAIEHRASLDDLNARLARLGVRVDGAFVSERVLLDFRAGWAEYTEHFQRTLFALLQALGVAPNRAEDAANALLAIVTTRIGQLVTRAEVIQSLERYRAPATDVVRSSGRRRPVRATDRVASVPMAMGSSCLVSYFPDEAVLLQFPDGTRGLIDCGPSAIRHIVPYLSKYGIDTLSFLALSHWHHTHYGGVPALLNAVSRIDRVWLSIDADRRAVIPAFRKFRGGSLLGRTALEVVDQLVARAGRDGTDVFFASGAEWIYGKRGGSAETDIVCGFTPARDEYWDAGKWDLNTFSAAYLVRVAGRQLLLGGHATLQRWPHVIDTARAAGITISADGFLLPHYASRQTLNPELIAALLNPTASVALLPVSEWVTQRFGNITSPKILDAIRANRGRVVVCDSREPSHFVMNREGLFQSLTHTQA